MGQVFKKTTTRPVPSGATIVEVGGKPTARAKNERLQTHLRQIESDLA